MLWALVLSLFVADAPVTGVVKDSTGAAVQGAVVILQAGSAVEQTTSGSDGRFAFDKLPDGPATLVVRAGGFAEYKQPVSGASNLDVVLSPATVFETVTVTPTRSAQRLGDVPASVRVLSSEEIRTSPALIADDVLRQVPTFSLFRRTSSLVAQPTTQGVSLRGIGPSGQSRTLVLLDGIPFNDPFGGWVYWTRVPLLSVDRIEITEDTTSSLYGNYAMGGVINILTSRPMRRTVEASPQIGNHKSPKFDFLATDQWRNLGVVVEGSLFNTDGFPIVAATERGPIDNNANVNYRNVSTKLEYLTDRLRAFGRVSYFTEDRMNGKVGEVNDTKWTTANGGIEARLPDGSTLQARVFTDVQKAHFNFLAVTNAATTRNLVRLATDQHVPTNGAGTTVLWTKAVGSAHVFSAGTDWRWVDGDSQENAYVAAVPTVVTPPVTQAATLSVRRVSGGSQQSTGAFVQDIYTPLPKLVLTLSARVDHWRNYDGHNLENTVATGLPTANNKPSLPDKDDTVVSPHLAALYHASDRVTVWGAANSGFRAPTLTELYRQFSVGAVTTRPNDQLGPERLVGGEVGVNIEPVRHLSVRATWFDNRVSDPVSNVTLTATLAQKQNLGKTRVRGLQTDAEYRLGASWRMSGAYIYDEATVTDGGVANAALVGKYLQQVPKRRGSAQVAYANPKYVNVALAVQFSGLQYNDDLNVNFIPPATLAAAGYDTPVPAGLPRYATVDLTASREVAHGVQVFFGVQNLFDKVYFVQTNPSTIGTPRLVNAGVRVRFSGR